MCISTQQRGLENKLKEFPQDHQEGTWNAVDGQKGTYT